MTRVFIAAAVTTTVVAAVFAAVLVRTMFSGDVPASPNGAAMKKDAPKIKTLQEILTTQTDVPPDGIDVYYDDDVVEIKLDGEIFRLSLDANQYIVESNVGKHYIKYGKATYWVTETKHFGWFHAHTIEYDGATHMLTNLKDKHDTAYNYDFNKGQFRRWGRSEEFNEAEEKFCKRINNKIALIPNGFFAEFDMIYTDEYNNPALDIFYESGVFKYHIGEEIRELGKVVFTIGKLKRNLYAIQVGEKHKVITQMICRTTKPSANYIRGECGFTATYFFDLEKDYFLKFVHDE